MNYEWFVVKSAHGVRAGYLNHMNWWDAWLFDIVSCYANPLTVGVLTIWVEISKWKLENLSTFALAKDYLIKQLSKILYETFRDLGNFKNLDLGSNFRV